MLKPIKFQNCEKILAFYLLQTLGTPLQTLGELQILGTMLPSLGEPPSCREISELAGGEFGHVYTSADKEEEEKTGLLYNSIIIYSCFAIKKNGKIFCLD